MFSHKDIFCGTPYLCKKHYYMPRHQDNITRNHEVFHKIEREYNLYTVIKVEHVATEKFICSSYHLYKPPIRS